MFKLGKLPTTEFADEKFAALKKKSKDEKKIAKAEKFLKALKGLSKDDRKAYDDAIGDLIEKTANFMTKAAALDTEVSKAADKLDKKKKDLKAKALTAIEHRHTVSKVSGALNSLAEAQAKAEGDAKDGKDGKDGKDDKDGKGSKLKEDDKETSGGGGAAGIIIGVIAAVGALGGVGYCYYKKKCCFAPKEEENQAANEGGQTDRKLYKKEVKSNNAHKRHAKEALIPAFKVADEQA